jgi:hypothetical protein
MQGVAAKNDASYDLSSARASVTGQTTIAASTATTSLPNGRIVTAKTGDEVQARQSKGGWYIHPSNGAPIDCVLPLIHVWPGLRLPVSTASTRTCKVCRPTLLPIYGA